MFPILIDHLKFTLVTELFILCEMLSAAHVSHLMTAHRKVVKVTGIRPNNLPNNRHPTRIIIHKML